jgi:hypothetical protein
VIEKSSPKGGDFFCEYLEDDNTGLPDRLLSDLVVHGITLGRMCAPLNVEMFTGVRAGVIVLVVVKKTLTK